MRDFWRNYMIQLEKLYEAARANLTGEVQDWEAFSTSLRRIMRADFILYRPTIEGGVLALRSLDRVLTSTNGELVKSYVKYRVFERNAIAEESLNALEPRRRSDLVCDEEFEQLPVVKEYFLPFGFFYMMGTAAILDDSSRLMLVLWRDRHRRDFSDLEKQRTALFMRYLAVLIKPPEKTKKPVPRAAVFAFGKKYNLTRSECSVLSELLVGKSLKDISSDSGRSYGTVRWHVQNILDKSQTGSQKNLLSEFYRLIQR